MNFTTEIILTPIETELNITIVELDEEISFDQIDFVVEVQFLEGLQGIPGKQIELGQSSTYIQWRYVGDTAWINLTPLSALKGNNGASCEFQVSATHIQWRVVGDTNWIDLIALSEFKGNKGDDGYTPYIGENGNWWINGEDTGENAIAPTMSVIEQYVTGYAEPKKGADDYFVSNAQVILINDIINKVDKITGHSIVADTEIAKIHTRNTDSTLLSENGLHSVYIDANGTFHVKDISQVGTTYETHAEQLFTTKNEIILRDGAIAGLGVGEYVGLRAKLYDGVNDGNLVFDKDGWARVGDVGALQKLATIEESPTNGYLMRYNSSTFRLQSYDPLLLPVSTAASRAFVNQNGGTIYQITRWFTPTSALLIEAGGLTAQQVGATQFTAAMVGAKLKLTNGVNEPIITAVDVPNRRITLSFAVDSSFFGQSVAVADWGVCSREKYQDASGNVYQLNKIGQTRTIVFNDGGLYSSNSVTVGGSNNIGTGQTDVSSTYKFAWSSDGNHYGTKDTGLFRPSAGLLQIYDGITTTALRDLKLRSLFADKIIPNSDTTGVVIRNAADTADVMKVDTANGNTKIVSGQFLIGTDVPTRHNTSTGYKWQWFDGASSFGAEAAGNFESVLMMNNIVRYNSAWDLQNVSNPGYMLGLTSGAFNRGFYIQRLNSANTFVPVIRSNNSDFVGINHATGAAIETRFDVNGTTTLRDWVYLNNGTHTGDALDDFRYKVLSGVLTFQKCTTANSVRGNGGWTTVSTI